MSFCGIRRNDAHEPVLNVVASHEHMENQDVLDSSQVENLKHVRESLAVWLTMIECYVMSPILLQVNISTLLSELDSPSPSPLPATQEDSSNSVFLLPKLLHTPEDADSWKRLPHTHWPALFALYNTSVYGGYVSILPPVHVSLAVSPDAARQLRHPQEEFRIREEMAVHSVEGLRKALELGEADVDVDRGKDKQGRVGSI